MTAPKDALLYQYLQHEENRLLRQKNGLESGKVEDRERLATVTQRLLHIQNTMKEIKL